jgi:hypothetical protein
VKSRDTIEILRLPDAELRYNRNEPPDAGSGGAPTSSIVGFPIRASSEARPLGPGPAYPVASIDTVVVQAAPTASYRCPLRP